MQNLAQLLPLQPIDSQTETQEQFEMPHLTQMLYTYIYNMGLSDNAGSITQKLDSFILERTSQISSETGLLSGKSNLVKQALEEIKANYLSWQTQLDRPISAQLDTPDSIKQDIKKTLKCYQKYFLSKFSSDGSIENCDQTIRDIFLNFDENSRFLDSINDSRDINNLKKLLKFLNNYLIELTITTEFKIKDGLDEEQPQREEDLNKIKTILLTFPGGNSSESSRIDFACIDGTVERIQEAISALSDCSIESRLIREKMETATTKFAENVPAGQQIHIGPCLLATLMLDIRKISEIDGSFATPKQNILLKEVIIFGYNFTKAIRDELSQTTENLLGQYCELLAKRNEDGAVTTISYRDLMEFVERSKYSGFAIDDIYNLFNDQDFVLESHEIEVTKLITSQQLKEKYFQIPTQKFKEELSKAQHSITQDLGGSELELGLKFDYLKYLLDPQNLFKVETISSRETSASGEAISADETVITSRIDPQKFQHLIALLLHKNIEVKSEETEYLYAGLITLRNLLDSYVTTDNLFLHFERFDHEFRKKTGIGFVDFFYEEHDGELHPKDEFKKVKSILQTIISKINYQKELFFANIEETAPLKALIEELFKLSETQDSQDSQDSQRSLIQALILNEQYHAVKNGLGENFLQILYQFDAQIFRKVLKGAPPQLITKTNITSLDDQGLSLIKILAEAGDKESLCLTLKKYKDNTSLDNLIALINDQNLLFDLVKENRLDILEEIFKIVSPEIKRVLDKVDSNNNTILLIACEKGYTKIALALIKAQASLNQADINGLTPLYIACFRGHTEIVKALIEAMVKKNKDHLNQVNKDDLTPLFAACQEGHTEIVKALIDAGADYNLSSKDGATPLYIACFRGHTEIVKTLIEAIVKENRDHLNQLSNDGYTPLYAACQNGHIEIVKALIEAKADYNLYREDRATPLYIACFHGHTEIVKTLIKAQASLNQADINGLTPLYIACFRGHTEIAKALIKKGADYNLRNKNGATPLFIACQEGHTEIVKALIKAKADCNLSRNDRTTPLFIACQEGHTEIVKALIKAGADCNLSIENGATPLYKACKNGHTEIVKALIKAGADCNLCSEDWAPPLFVACQEGHTEIVKDLIGAGASYNLSRKNGATPLLVACEEGHTEIVKALIEKGAYYNLSSKNGETPLLVACEQGHTEIVKTLIETMVRNKDDLNQVDKNGLTPLFAACQEGHTEIVKALIEAGADYNLSSEDGATPLFVACQNGHTEIAKAIIQAMVRNKDDLNQVDKNGLTPLFIAYQNGHTEIVKALIEAGADYNLSSEDGATPLFVACQNGHTEIAKAIIQAMVRNKDDLNQVDKNGLTPLFIACQEGHTEIAEALFNGGANFYYTQKSSIFFRAFRWLAYDLRDVSPEIKALITKFTDPKRIKFRDQTLEKAKISKRQVEFNNNARSELDLQFLDNPSPRADGITELSESSQLQQYRKNFQKEFINGLLFLKFVALEFSSNEKSILTPEERISEMLKIYLSENKILKDIPLIIDRVVNNENGLQDFFKTATIQELIALGLNSQPEISALEFAQKDQEQLDQMLSENVEEKLNEIIASICSSKYPLGNAISSGRPTVISSLTFANIENLDSSRVTNLRSVRREDARKGITTRYAL